MSTRTPGIRPGRVVSEFILIVAGVLSALAADGWREDRIETEQGRAYAARLAEDLRTDIALWEVSITSLRAKEPALRRLARVDRASFDADPDQVAADLWIAQGWSWGSYDTNDATYREMSSAGDLNLIRDPRLRADVAAHYTTREARLRSMEARRTDIGPLTFRLLLGSETRPEPNAWGIDRPDTFDHDFVDAATEADLRAIRRESTGELNANEFGIGVGLRLLSSSEALLARIEAYDGR